MNTIVVKPNSVYMKNICSKIDFEEIQAQFLYSTFVKQKKHFIPFTITGNYKLHVVCEVIMRLISNNEFGDWKINLNKKNGMINALEFNP